MPRRVRVHLEAGVRRQIVGRLQQPGPQAHGLLVSGRDIVDVKVEVDLLRRALGPIRWDVVRGELDGHPWLAVNVDGVPVVIRLHRPAHQARPRRS